ncbi:MAG: hypothetical protein FH753_02525 [Firmicutes bacterium]|nr:hypothetical protein [Bacillota bacterium]
MNKLLYYPTILIPGHWLKKAVFFSDQISSIYPYGFTPEESLYEKQLLAEMEYLKSLGIYNYTRPEDLDMKTFNQLLKDIKSFCDTDMITNLRNNFKDSKRKYEIYNTKLNNEIIRFLIDNKVAESDKYGSSILLEENIALKYMSLLASYSAQNCSYSISTDSLMNQEILFQDYDLLEHNNYLDMVINKIPYPSELTPLEDIINFKKQNRKLLLDYRLFLNNWLLKLKNDQSFDTLNTFNDEIERLNLEIRGTAKSSKLKLTFDTIEVLIQLTGDVAINNHLKQLSENNLEAIVARAGINIAAKKIKSVFNKSNLVEGSPHNYLLKAKFDGIL